MRIFRGIKPLLHQTIHRFDVSYLLAGAVCLAAAAAPKPNVILILADDLGWTDLAGFGSDLVETPALDQLARDGMKFTPDYQLGGARPYRAGA